MSGKNSNAGNEPGREHGALFSHKSRPVDLEGGGVQAAPPPLEARLRAAGGDRVVERARIPWKTAAWAGVPASSLAVPGFAILDVCGRAIAWGVTVEDAVEELEGRR